MRAEERLLLRCLADLCAGSVTEKPEDPLDLDAFSALADSQDLAALAHVQCRRWMGMESGAARLRNAFLSAVFASVNFGDILRDIASRFQAAEIPFLIMKGSVYRACWPEPALRSMGDMDLVIRPEDRQQADAILMEMGCRRMIDNAVVWTYWIGDFMLEIHDHMFYEHLTSSFDYIGYFDRVWEHTKRGTVFGIDDMLLPEENFHFLYLMTHTAKHVVNSGCGFRPFLDMVFACRAWSDRLDWAWLETELAKMELLAFTKTCFSLCERWFGVTMPLERAPVSDAFYETATEKLFRDGLFGLENAENEGGFTAKELKRSRGPYWLAASKLVLQKVFPAYREMRYIPWYRFLDGRPWLLPAAWVYRWGYVLAHKRELGAAKLTEPFARRNEIEKREQEISGWGV